MLSLIVGGVLPPCQCAAIRNVEPLAVVVSDPVVVESAPGAPALTDWASAIAKDQSSVTTVPAVSCGVTPLPQTIDGEIEPL